MATSIDIKALPKALALIDRYGIMATFVVETGAYSDATQKVTSTAATFQRKVTPPVEKRAWDPGAGVTRIEHTEVVMAAQGLLFTPARGQKVTIGGTAYAISELEAIYSGEQVAAWVLRLT